MKQTFSKLPLVEFWCSLLQEYLQVSKCAMLKHLLFPITYLYKAGFSRHVETKSKYHYTLYVITNVRIQLYDEETTPFFTAVAYETRFNA